MPVFVSEERPKWKRKCTRVGVGEFETQCLECVAMVRKYANESI